MTQISRHMVFDWGMGSTVNSLALKANNYSLSERTKELRDAEQRELAEHAYERAREMLAERRDLLVKLAEILLEQESLDQKEVEEILGVEHPKPGPVRSTEVTATSAAFSVAGGGPTAEAQSAQPLNASNKPLQPFPMPWDDFDPED